MGQCQESVLWPCSETTGHSVWSPVDGNWNVCFPREWRQPTEATTQFCWRWNRAPAMSSSRVIKPLLFKGSSNKPVSSLSPHPLLSPNPLHQWAFSSLTNCTVCVEINENSPVLMETQHIWGNQTCVPVDRCTWSPQENRDKTGRPKGDDTAMGSTGASWKYLLSISGGEIWLTLICWLARISHNHRALIGPSPARYCCGNESFVTFSFPYRTQGPLECSHFSHLFV